MATATYFLHGQHDALRGCPKPTQNTEAPLKGPSWRRSQHTQRAGGGRGGAPHPTPPSTWAAMAGVLAQISDMQLPVNPFTMHFLGTETFSLR